jgi:malate permease and related proteins
MFLGNNAQQLLAAISTVFSILAVGFVLQRLRPFSQETLNQLTRLLVDILLPLYLFYITASATLPSAATAPIVFLAGLLIPLISLLLAVTAGKFAKASSTQAPSFHFAAMVGNTSFIGIPVCASLFGATGVIYAVLYDFGTAFIVFTVGVWVLFGAGKASFRALVANPFITTVIAGLVWAWLGWEFPTWIDRPLQSLSNTAIPLALLLVGIKLGDIRTSFKGKLRLIGWLTAIRLVLTPLVVAVLLRLFSLESTVAGVILVQSGMPVGLITAILTARNNMDSDLPAAAVLWSTIGLGLILPAIIYWLL